MACPTATFHFIPTATSLKRELLKPWTSSHLGWTTLTQLTSKHEAERLTVPRLTGRLGLTTTTTTPSSRGGGDSWGSQN